ncbi:hypothetical protein [Shumkonia mesophila]|uniref:hypothetical protein n=1 Tax=Shumkonia mesophila TaxID=2838854 RepID=UPI002934119F|nr:hypothetical protein [Shumkonia mesophila]
MPSLLDHYDQCRKILCNTAKRRETITYGNLAKELGLRLPRQAWNTVLDPIYEAEMRKTGKDLTLVVVYASGPAKKLCRYFSNGQPARTKRLNPRNVRQVSDYKRELEKVFDAYAVMDC